MALSPHSRAPAVVAVALAALALSVAVPAHAKCGFPAEVILAPGAGVVPPNPVLRMFVNLIAPPTLVARSNGVVVPVTVHRDGAASAFDAYRVEVHGAGPGPLELRVQSGAAAQSWSLDVDATWRAPPNSRAPIAVTKTNTHWACSFQSTRNLGFAGAAAAYRLVAADSSAALAAGQGRQIVLPHDPAQLWGGAVQERADLQLGSLDCLGDTFSWGKHGVWFKVFALLTDGSEQPVTGAPILIMPP